MNASIASSVAQIAADFGVNENCLRDALEYLASVAMSSPGASAAFAAHPAAFVEVGMKHWIKNRSALITEVLENKTDYAREIRAEIEKKVLDSVV